MPGIMIEARIRRLADGWASPSNPTASLATTESEHGKLQLTPRTLSNAAHNASWSPVSQL